MSCYLETLEHTTLLDLAKGISDCDRYDMPLDPALRRIREELDELDRIKVQMFVAGAEYGRLSTETPPLPRVVEVEDRPVHTWVWALALAVPMWLVLPPLWRLCIEMLRWAGGQS